MTSRVLVSGSEAVNHSAHKSVMTETLLYVFCERAFGHITAHETDISTLGLHLTTSITLWTLNSIFYLTTEVLHFQRCALLRITSVPSLLLRLI